MLLSLINEDTIKTIMGVGVVGIPGLQLWVMFQISNLKKELKAEFDDIRKTTHRAIGNVEERVHRIEVARAGEREHVAHIEYVMKHIAKFAGMPPPMARSADTDTFIKKVDDEGSTETP